MWTVVVLLTLQSIAHALTPQQLGVVVNDADPLSVEIGRYYAQRRGIPAVNVVHVRFDAARTVLPLDEFEALKREIDATLGAHVQALALTWAQPYRASCMSITAAFAFGFDTRYCAEGCRSTQWSRYFNSSTRRPFTQLQVRPTMSIAAVDFEHARQLIDRGIAADGSQARGVAYLVETGDLTRNVRASTYRDAKAMVDGRIPVAQEQVRHLHKPQDVMFYFIGAARVDGLDSMRFLPGAAADHLTSLGGLLTDSSQMSSLRWLEAGATGSYGAVVEPCNFPAKFPNPGILMKRYLDGDTLIEAYWKSVAMPGQGVFVGEPLARVSENETAGFSRVP